MKTLLIAFVVFASVCMAKAQDTDLIGTWNLIEFTMVNAGESETTTEEELRGEDAVWDLFIMEQGKFKQTSNMSGSGTMDSQEGTWESPEDNLIFVLQMEGNEFRLGYTYELKGDILVLTRSNPSGTMKVVPKFRRNK